MSAAQFGLLAVARRDRTVDGKLRQESIVVDGGRRDGRRRGKVPFYGSASRLLTRSDGQRQA